jgi:hypothetical protein
MNTKIPWYINGETVHLADLSRTLSSLEHGDSAVFCSIAVANSTCVGEWSESCWGISNLCTTAPFWSTGTRAAPSSLKSLAKMLRMRDAQLRSNRNARLGMIPARHRRTPLALLSAVQEFDNLHAMPVRSHFKWRGGSVDEASSSKFRRTIAALILTKNLYRGFLIFGIQVFKV